MIGYWMYETTGVLRPAIEAYLKHQEMTEGQIDAMRAYLRQWMSAAWKGDGVDGLRDRVDELTSQAAIARWLDDACNLDIDPL